jgi:hypothetical protein
MNIKEELINKFPFLKTKTAKYIIAFSIIRKMAALIIVLYYFY